MPAGEGPLAGRGVLVTRPKDQAAELTGRLEALGAVVHAVPAIEIYKIDGAARDARLTAPHDWVVLTSANAARMLLEALGGSGVAPGTRIAAIGPSTAKVLEAAGLTVDLVPQVYRAEALLEALVAAGVAGKRVLVPRALEARDVLPDGLAPLAAVDVVPIYETRVAAGAGERLAELLGAGAIDAVTFLSSSAVESFHEMLSSPPRDGVVFAAIGPVTADTARALGLAPVVVAREATVAGLVDALVQHYRNVQGRIAMPFPIVRPRRLRTTPALRDMVRETNLRASALMMPLFVVHGEGVRREIESMPGNYHLSPDRLVDEVKRSRDLGIKSVLLFGIPAAKDPLGKEAYAEDGIVQKALRTLKQACPEMVLVADVCMCEYTSHGHCGELVEVGGRVDVHNDRTLELLAKSSVSFAKAGADVIAPSDMMDGRVAAIRAALDNKGHERIPVLSYAAKYASAFYGPFRTAAQSAPSQGDRKSYQMDPGNVREALREIELDIEEGADMVMVKPALAYLDVIRAVKERFDVPVAAYNVSGEFSMVKAAAAKGWIDEKRIVMEIATALTRAGADILITYHANDIARWLEE